MNEIRIRPLTIRLTGTLTAQSINRMLMWMFTFFVVFTPVDVFGLKKLSLIVLLAVNLDSLEIRDRRMKLPVIGAGLIVTTATILLSYIHTGELWENITQGYMGYILLLYIVIEKHGIDFKKIFTDTLLLMALFTVAMAALDFTRIIPMKANPLLNWMHDTGIALVGKGSHLVTGYVIFVKTCPLLVIIIPGLYSEKRYGATVLTFLALFISGTRANIITGFGVLAATILVKKNKNNFEWILVMISAGVVIASAGRAMQTISDMFVMKKDSDAVRTGELESILQIFRSEDGALLLGRGYTSEFFNSGRGRYASIIELSYWNLLRQVGLFLFIPMMICYFYPVAKLARTKGRIPMAVGYLGYLVIAYTNPLLYSTTGVLALLYMYSLIHQYIPYEKDPSLRSG